LVYDVALVLLHVFLQLLVLLGQRLGVVDGLFPLAICLGLLARGFFGLEGQLLQTLLHLLAVALKVIVLRDIGLGVGRASRFVFRSNVIDDLNLKIVFFVASDGRRLLDLHVRSWSCPLIAAGIVNHTLNGVVVNQPKFLVSRS
jgi:hypothetical protein